MYIYIYLFIEYVYVYINFMTIIDIVHIVCTFTKHQLFGMLNLQGIHESRAIKARLISIRHLEMIDKIDTIPVCFGDTYHYGCFQK